MKRLIKIILLIICLSVFLFSAYKIYEYFSEEKANKDLNNRLIDSAITYNKNQIKNDSSENKDEFLPISVDFNKLKKENKDIVGWIYLDNTKINYPVVQASDNNYYLRRLVNGKSNRAGSIFMDYRNNPNLDDNNTIIYGHNMKNSTMFGTLLEYKEQSYYDNHKSIYYFTEDKNYIIEIFAGFTTSADSEIYNLNKDISKSDIQELINKSDFKSDIDLENLADMNKIITLSTCSYDYNGARYVVFGFLKEVN